MIWGDPADGEKLNNAVNSKIESIGKDNSKIQAKIDKGGLNDKKIAKLEAKMSSNNQKVSLLKQSLSDIKAIGEAKETYTLSKPSKDDGTQRVVKTASGVINIEGSNTSLHLHEIRHIGQALEAGGLKFNSKGELLNSATTKNGMRENEVNAYQTGYSYDSRSYPPASSLKDINHQSLMEIKREDGTPMYERLKD
jgi:hypothetical protein